MNINFEYTKPWYTVKVNKSEREGGKNNLWDVKLKKRFPEKVNIFRSEVDFSGLDKGDNLALH